MENQGSIRPGVKKYRDGGYTLGDGKADVGIIKTHIEHSLKAAKLAETWKAIFIFLIIISFLVSVVMFLSGNFAVQAIAPIFLGIAGGLVPVTLLFYFVYRYFAMKHEQYIWEEYQWYISLKVMSGQSLKKGELIVSTPVKLYLNEEIAKNGTEKE